MRFLLSLLSLIGLVVSCYAQTAEHVPGQALVSLRAELKGANLERSLAMHNGMTTGLETIEQVSPYMNIWLMSFDEESIDEAQMLKALRAHPMVEIAQFNHVVNQRAVPNDALFGEQWQYVNDGSNGGVVDADIDADEAWDITTGGVTVQGDDIVAAALDDGIDLAHPDFGDNRWVNAQEIPNNGIDDDNNGYVDDYDGWSIISDSDDVSGGGHGTPVAGIIGAKGNNGIGVTGVNWDVKVMIIKNNFNTNEAAVLEAYSYTLTMREMYNNSNGAEGAFVVATNASWGVDFGNPEDAPLWCGFYDIMGQEGILSCGATINGNQNVDIIGDLPTACPSDFMISVTNCDNTDNKVTQAGFGAETIDLGAHGANAFTTALGQGYGGFGGTSGATPHVTGAIALLYSAPCPSFIALAKSDPEAAALLARQYILDGVDPNASLDGITTTGGRLNIKNSLDLLMADCATGDCFPPYNLTASAEGSNSTLSWESFEEGVTYNLRYRAVGDPDWITIPSVVNNAFVLSDLTLCTAYEFEVQTDCGDDTSDFSNTFSWTTDGCCEPPSTVDAISLSESTITVSWDPVLAAVSYNVRYRMLGTDEWIEVFDVTGTELLITDVVGCSAYEVAVSTNCDAGVVTPYTDAVTVNTEGCGACVSLPYCAASSDNASEEWISAVVLNTLDNSSGSDGGYGDYTFVSTMLDPGASYDISATPDYSGQTWDEYFTAWIDFDQNGTFDPDELVLDSDGLVTSTVTDNFTVPADAMPGGTRLRIAMRYNEQAGPCEQGFDYGEVEDYCVMISDPATGITERSRIDLSVFPNPASDQLNVRINSDENLSEVALQLCGPLGRILKTFPLNSQRQVIIDVSSFEAGTYVLMLRDDQLIRSTKTIILSK